MVALTFGFGLIHGFGFANILQELALPRGALALSLLGFNLGVEIGQIAIVALALPCAYVLRRQWMYPRLVLTFGSVMTTGIALLWFVERAFDLPPLLPAAADVDLRAELTGTAPYVLRHLDPPLIISGGILLVLLGTTYALWHIGRRTGRAWRWESPMSLRLVRYGWGMALGLMALGLGVTYNAAQQEARLIVKGQEIAASLAEPLRRQLRIAEPRDRSYQTQLAAMQEAIAFLVEPDRKDVTTDRLAEILDQLAMGHTAIAQTFLKDQAEVAASRGDAATAALAERHRGALALVVNPQTALEAYSHAVDLEPAAAMFRQAINADQALGHQLGLAINYANLASVYQMQGDLEAAEALYYKALTANEQLGRIVGKAANYAHLGHLYRQRGAVDQAGDMYRQSLALFTEAGSTTGATQVQVWLDALKTAAPLQ